MYPFLDPLLDRLGLRGKPRYTLEETAEIIGIRRDQVLDLLKRGKLIGKRASERRWGGILADDLDDYLEDVNAPWVRRCNQIASSAPAVMSALVAVSTQPTLPPLNLPVTTIIPPTPPTPRNRDPCGALPINETPDPIRTPKPNINF